MRYHQFFWLIFLFVLIAGCVQSPTEPRLVTSKELSQIPFEKLAGQIVFKRTLKDQPERYYFMMLNAHARDLESIAIFDTYVPTNLMLSPNADKILFSYYVYKGQTRSFLWQMYVMNIASKVEKNIAPSLYDDSYGAWSPDGRKIAFWSNRERRSSIWLADLERDSSYRLIDVAEIARSRPAWLADGSAIVFSALDENFHPIFYRLELATETLQPVYRDTLTSNDVVFKHPMISHDGSMLAFVKSFKARFDEIWLFNFKTGGAGRLTTGFHDWHPAWSPDDSEILFSRGSYLFLIELVEGALTQITFGDHIDEYPSWAP